MKYIYKARTKEGKEETGTIEASSKEAAVLLLQKYNIFITSLNEERAKQIFFKEIKFNKKVSKKDLAIFSRQLAVMLSSHVPIIQSLQSLALQASKENFRKIILEVSKSVEEGVPFSGALSRFPATFDVFYVNLIRSGEVSGKISYNLYYIADNLEKETSIANQVRQAIIYPAFTLSVLFIVLNIVVIFLLPKIKTLIKESGSKSTPFTIFILNFYDFLGKFWWVMLLGFILFIFFGIFYFRTSKGKEDFDRISLRIPFIGDIMRKVFLARFCSSISTLMVAGVSINKSLEITASTVNNNAYKRIINEVGIKVSEGQKVSVILAGYKDYFPSFVVQIIKVGEETGKLDEILMEVANFYQKEIKRAIDLFLALLEPILIIFLGIIVMVLAVSVFVPLYGTFSGIE